MIMMFNIKKYNREINALKSTANDSSLHPLRLAQLKQQLLEKVAAITQTKSSGTSLLQQENKIGFTYRLMVIRYVLPTIAGVFLIGGTVLASNSALPGQPLYPVKRLKEKVELGLTISEKGHAEVMAKHAQERLVELDQIAPPLPNQYDAQNLVVTEEVHNEQEDRARLEASNEIQGAINKLSEVKNKLESKGDKEEVTALNKTIKHLTFQAERHAIKVVLNDNEKNNKNSNEQSGENAPPNIRTGLIDDVKSKIEDNIKKDHKENTKGGNRENSSSDNKDLINLVSGTGIYGQILIGPSCPVLRSGNEDECTNKPYQATIVIKSQDGSVEVAQFISDIRGRFKFELKPGTYTLVPLSPNNALLPKGAPQQVTVKQNIYTKVIIPYDTGIR
jgi:hypothetical protein